MVYPFGLLERKKQKKRPALIPSKSSGPTLRERDSCSRSSGGGLHRAVAIIARIGDRHVLTGSTSEQAGKRNWNSSSSRRSFERGWKALKPSLARITCKVLAATRSSVDSVTTACLAEPATTTSWARLVPIASSMKRDSIASLAAKVSAATPATSSPRTPTKSTRPCRSTSTGSSSC